MSEQKATPHYLGHRDRLRSRFAATGGDGMPDYEILELLLSQVIPRRDVKPIAKTLLDRFGSLGEVLSASADDLQETKGVGESTAISLKVVQTAGLRLAQQHVMNTNVLNSWDKLLDYCKSAMGYDKIEQVRVLYLNQKNTLIADEVQQRGTVNHTPVYPREVVKRALELHASALILVHNHPSGDPTPSRDDIDMTNEIKDTAGRLGIVLHDHIIIGKRTHSSFKSMGLI